MEFPTGCALRRPRIVALPFVRTRLKDPRFRWWCLTLVLEIVSKKRCLQFFAEIGAGVGIERNSPEPVAPASSPAAMIPRTNHQEVLVLGVVLFEQFVDLEWSSIVFLVVPSGH